MAVRFSSIVGGAGQAKSGCSKALYKPDCTLLSCQAPHALSKYTIYSQLWGVFIVKGVCVGPRRPILYSPAHSLPIRYSDGLLVAGSSHTRLGILGYMFWPPTVRCMAGLYPCTYHISEMAPYIYPVKGWLWYKGTSKLPMTRDPDWLSIPRPLMQVLSKCSCQGNDHSR